MLLFILQRARFDDLQLFCQCLKYTKAGAISIYMDPIRHQTLVIEDTVVGIRLEDLPKVFNKGYSELNGRLNDKSSGLGLFLSKTICHRLDYDLTIESKPNQGTKVRITFARDKLIPFS
ncbi:ATP-binding protein [Planococcus lenghuensis]|uniref:histidine kinase n=1 Tax=Planococcus lenghuensis TaxID=2213202 RepID=A0A1Q2KZ21_9BACL|nr:ATP-binding protein [Planococcus lenghuensis]AQQ53374.1 hypothetical protein B0X71_09995 [Planococcus lenghuensis]